jgi:drug/metabolite transporter (DMT)-like permease
VVTIGSGKTVGGSPPVADKPGRVSDRGLRSGGTAVAVGYIFLWASAFVPSKVASTESTPLWFLVVRFATAGTIMFLVARAAGLKLPATRAAWISICGVGILANAAYLGLTYTALHRLSSGMGAIVASTNPLVLALVAPYFLREPLTLRKAAGLLLGFGGVVLMMIARTGTQTALPADVGLAFLGVTCSVASTIVFKRKPLGEHLYMVNAIQLLAGAAALVPVAAAIDGMPHATLGWPLVVSFVYLVVMLSIGASVMWFWLLTHGEASRVSAFYYLTPVFGLAISALILGERVGIRDLAGLCAIALGIVLVQRK